MVAPRAACMAPVGCVSTSGPGQKSLVVSKPLRLWFTPSYTTEPGGGVCCHVPPDCDNTRSLERAMGPDNDPLRISKNTSIDEPNVPAFAVANVMAIEPGLAGPPRTFCSVTK